jgi:hypothetical protein
MKVKTDGATYLYALRALPGHVPLHCLWAYGKGRAQLSHLEQTHVEACSMCSHALSTCSEAENFGAVLKELDRERYDARIPDEKPKLKTLLIFPGPISKTDRGRTD